MEKEISASTFLGIVLIALAGVVGLAFGIFTIAKGVGNDGQVQVSDALNTASNLIFTDYDQKIVTGNRVIALYDEVEGRPFALLVNTKSMTKGVKTDIGDTKYIQKVNGLNYINYNAILSNDGLGDIGHVVSINGGEEVIEGNDDIINFTEGTVTTNYGFIVDSTTGNININSGIKGWINQGSCEYINQNSKFESDLIKDTSSQIVGVVFTQID